MKIIETVAEMREFIAAKRQAGKTIGLVPTMGALHEGHLTLMRTAKAKCDVVVASIFVNPTQFGPNEDLDSYPRDLAGDAVKAESAGVEAIFHPQPSEMYSAGYATYINVEGITDKLCGKSRPGHFRGVATVVSKLFNIVQPDTAFFGQKDAQQVAVIERMVRDLNMAIQIEVVTIVREADGLARSSRNTYLSKEEREAALVLSRSLRLASEAAAKGERKAAALKSLVETEIKGESLAKIEYVEIYSYPDLAEIEEVKETALLAVAVRFGTTRLIDNIIFNN
ncbi:MAG: pantoate--beta-alanine ligase [Pelosinus sp.]|nr:pantoate--beta-alanine ligase [Pelosinus sp.]